MEEAAYFPLKLKRKDLDEVNDDFCDFSLSSPARKIRRLDAELPPIIEEEEAVNPVVFGQAAPSQDAFVEQVIGGSPIAIHDPSGSLPENDERAIVLFDPMKNMLSLQSRKPFSLSVNSDFLSGYKNPVIRTNWSHLLKSLDGKTKQQEDDSEPANGSLAVVPWVPMHSQHQGIPEVEPVRTEASEMMDEDDTEAITMDIEDSNQMPKTDIDSVNVNGSEGVNQWQQHCMIPQPPCNLATPVTWSGTGA